MDGATRMRSAGRFIRPSFVACTRPRRTNRATPSRYNLHLGPIPPIRQRAGVLGPGMGTRESPKVDDVIAGAAKLIANKFEVRHIGKKPAAISAMRARPSQGSPRLMTIRPSFA